MFPKAVKDTEDYGVVLKFFESLLRSDSECRLEDEYPLAFNSSRTDHIFVCRSATGEPLAGLATLERDIEHQRNSRLKALFVGSVVTDLKVRNQGLQRQLFHAVEEAAEKWNVDFLVLWSNQLEFYKKLGFELAGLQASWTPSLQSVLQKSSVKVDVGSTLEIPFTERFYEAFSRKIFRVSRTVGEMKSLWTIPKMTVACTESAYALLGKGEDFQGICHEWAGPADEVLACFDALRTHSPSLRILSPGVLHDPAESAVVTALEEGLFECRLEYLGLFKAISPRIQIQDLSPENLKFPFFIWGLDSI